MVRVSTMEALRDSLADTRRNRRTIGFVPTMGALHAGHASLIDRARRASDMVVTSIFVNPLQFGPSEDYTRYPRPIEDDENLARACGTDVLFTPTVSEMYPVQPTVTISAGRAAARWEGEIRPGHFDGMLTVVAKLFNMVNPHFAVFGQKDLQQVALVGMMVRDLSMTLSVIVAPTVRDEAGLAMSSRNRFLTPAEKTRALVLSRALNAARLAYRNGETDPPALEAAGMDVFRLEPEVQMDYFAVVDRQTFEPAAGGESREPVGAWAAITAARVGETRLIDNVILDETNGN